MKITYKTRQVMVSLTNPEVEYTLNTTQDIKGDVEIYLRGFGALEKVRAHLDHYNNPDSLRSALRAALCGDLEPGRKILGSVVHNTAMEQGPGTFRANLVYMIRTSTHSAVYKWLGIKPTRQDFAGPWTDECKLELINLSGLYTLPEICKRIDRSELCVLYQLVKLGTDNSTLRRLVDSCKIQDPGSRVPCDWETFMAILVDGKREDDTIYTSLRLVGFTWPHPTPNSGKQWEADHEFAVKINIGKCSTAMLARLLGRTPIAVLAKAIRLGHPFDWAYAIRSIK